MMYGSFCDGWQAYAAAKFGEACLRALQGETGIIECAYVASEVTEFPFFATKVRLGRNGVEEIFPLGPLNSYEREGLEKMKAELHGSIEKGVNFVHKPKSS
jgi:malate dehydrogenase